MNFRTHQRDAIIFLAAGETDYCLMELRNGRLRVRVNLGSGESVLQSPRGLRLDDYVWHTAQLSRRNAQATLTVDRQYVSHLIIPGVFYQLNIIYGMNWFIAKICCLLKSSEPYSLNSGKVFRLWNHSNVVKKCSVRLYEIGERLPETRYCRPRG